MLENDRTYVSEGINYSSNIGLCECNIYHYCYFVKINLRSQREVCNDSHHLIQKTMGVNDFSIVSIKINNHRIRFMHKSKVEAVERKHYIDINKIAVSRLKKGFEFFIGYKGNEKVVPLCIMLPKIMDRVKL